ncbi:Protein of unknown function DUF86, SO_3166 group, partial [hydrothermal vent metagenome]
EHKLESLRKCIARVESRCPDTIEALIQDIDAQDVLVLNLTRAIQLCVDISVHVLSAQEQSIPDTMGKAFRALSSAGIIDDLLADRMCKAVGFRNIAVHDYEEVNFAIVFAIAQERLFDFRLFAKKMLSIIEQPNE